MGQILDLMRRAQSKEELLYRSALAGNVFAVKALFEDGANLEWFDQERKTVLIAVCLYPYLYEVVRALIELGANINAYSPGWNAGTPLHHAAKKGCTEIVKLLLSHGVNALVVNDDGQTPLDIARRKGFTEVVRLIENHISFFIGWLRECRSPSFLGLFAPHLLSKKSPRVVFCGYSIPLPSENRVNIRVQTTGALANEVFKDGCQNLMSICQHVRSTFSNSVEEFKRNNSMDED